MATSQSRALIATNAVFLGLAIFAVAMRIYARKYKVLFLQADDYLILAALVNSSVHRPVCRTDIAVLRSSR